VIPSLSCSAAIPADRSHCSLQELDLAALAPRDRTRAFALVRVPIAFYHLRLRDYLLAENSLAGV